MSESPSSTAPKNKAPGFIAQLAGFAVLVAALSYGIRIPLEAIGSVWDILLRSQDVEPYFYGLVLSGAVATTASLILAGHFFGKWGKGGGRKLYLKSLVLAGIIGPVALNLVGAIGTPSEAVERDGVEVDHEVEMVCETRTGIQRFLPTIGLDGSWNRGTGSPGRLDLSVTFCEGDLLGQLGQSMPARLDLSSSAEGESEQ